MLRWRYFSSHSIISRSRWLVGSSRMSKSGLAISTEARATLFCCPPESKPMGLSSWVILSWVRICCARSCTSVHSSSASKASVCAWRVCPSSAMSKEAYSARRRLATACRTGSSGEKSGDCSSMPMRSPFWNTMSPESAVSFPAMRLRSVDFPAPFLAMSPTCCPSATLNERSSKRTKSPILLVKFCISK